MTTAAPAVIEPIQRPDTRIGLFASAQPIPAVRWPGGVAYRPLGVGTAEEHGETFDPCGTFDVDTESVNAVYWEPWGIAIGDDCLSGSTDELEERERAERRLEIQTEYLTGKTFWTGAVGGSTFSAIGWPNRPLADSAATDLTSGGPVGVVSAFSLAVQYLADVLGSERGMIHVAPALLPFLAYYRVAQREGNQVLTTIADHIVVASPGYVGTSPTGSDPDAARSWIYVTSLVRAAEGPIRLTPFLDRTTNNLETRASRLVLAEWDLQAHAAIHVCLPDPGPACT